MVSCNCDDLEPIAEECPCFNDDQQPPFFKSCEDNPKKSERHDCMVSELLSFVYSNVKYTSSARENCVEGTVIIRIEVSDTGEILQTEAINNPHLGHGLEEEALRVVDLMEGMWCPGLVECNPVDMEYILPFLFKLAK